MLDLTYSAKARGLAISAAAGGTAAFVTKIVAGVIFPEVIAVILCAPAFAEASDAATERFQKSIQPSDLTIREMRAPRWNP